MANSQGGDFLAVDDVNVYVLAGESLLRIPKNGGPATLVNEAGATVVNATSLGSIAYWVETVGNSGPEQSVAVKSTPLLSGPITTIASFVPAAPVLDQIAVTSDTVFVGLERFALFDLPLTGTGGGARPVDGGPTGWSGGHPCNAITSDANAVYCAEDTGSNLLLESDGTTTTLGAAASSSYIVSDDTYAYWVDHTTAGTIMKAPKAGGGTATVVAYDTNPTAVAVDATSIYWSDEDGYVKSIPK